MPPNKALIFPLQQDGTHTHDDALGSHRHQQHKYMPESVLAPPRNRDANSTHRLSRMDIAKASIAVKRFVEDRLESDLHVVKHTTPLAFVAGTGVNDQLDGSASKAPVKFVVPNKDIPRGVKPSAINNDEPGEYQLDCEVVQSLAKWKRLMLERLGCDVGSGLYCDSTSIRKGYKGDTSHSVIADQWDWEIKITEDMRTVETLKSTVRAIWKIITDAEDYILKMFPNILLEGHPTANFRLPKEIHFITSEDLYARFPDIPSPRDRETAIVRELGAVFVIGMGWPMHDGSAPQEVRSPSYDDWTLNGDIFAMHPLLEHRFELSSMGIRVTKDSLLAQLEHRGLSHEANMDFQKALINGELPFSMGGGIGISRLLMLLLRTGHIGEVQVGIWHADHIAQAKDAGCDIIPDRIIR